MSLLFSARVAALPRFLFLIFALLVAPFASACVFSGGIPCPQDCVRDGGTAICEEPQPIQNDPLETQDPDFWKYGNCSYSWTAAIARRWCEAAGGIDIQEGSWKCLVRLPKQLLPYPPYASQIAYTVSSPLMPLADGFIERSGFCSYGRTIGAWGINLPAGDYCWPPGSPTVQYGHRNGEARQITYTGYTNNSNNQCVVPATANIVQTRQRTIGCPRDYTLRTWPNGTARCYREIEDICLMGNPVQPFAGTKLESFGIDFGPEFGDLLNLEYSSAARPRTTVPFLLGSHWGLRFEKQLVTEVGVSGTVRKLIHAVGQPEYFGPDGWSLIATREGKSRLVAIGSETKWIDARNHQWTFNQTGRLIRLQRPDGSRVEFTSNDDGDGIIMTSASGRKVVVDPKMPEFYLVRIFDYFHASTSATINVWADGRVSHLERQGGTTTFDFADTRFPWALTSIQDETGRTTTSYLYDGSAKVTNEYHWPAGAAVQHYAFNRANSSVLATWPLGGQTTYTTTVADGVRRLSTVSQYCPSCPSGKIAGYTYNGNGEVNTTTAFNGILTTYQRNAAGWPAVVTEVANTVCPAGQPNCQLARRTVETEWDANWKVPLITRVRRGDAAGPTESLIRRTLNSARGQVTARCIVDPADSTALAYACGSQSNAPARVRQTIYRYCEESDIDFGSSLCPIAGYLRSIDGPRTDVTDITTYEYRAANYLNCLGSPVICAYGRGDLWKVTNAAGHVTENLDYDALGRVLRQRDANLVITDLSYNDRGWLIERTVRGNPDGSSGPADVKTTIEYENYGEVKRVISADNSAIEYCRDQVHRLTAIVMTTAADPSRCNGPTPLVGTTSIRYTLDNQGNRIREESRDPAGTLRKLLARQYNSLGQLRSLVNSRYANMPNLDDPLQVKKTTFTYDVNGNQDLVTDAKGVVSDNDHDPLDRLILQIQDKDLPPAGGGEIDARVGYEFDVSNRLTKVVDPKGLSTDYVRDGLGDQVELRSPDTKTTVFTFDSAGNTITKTDAREIATHYVYDALNRLTSRTFPSEPGLDEGFHYDQVNPDCALDERYPQGRLTRFTDGSGETRLCYDRHGNVRRKIQVTDGQSRVVEYGYDAANRLSSITYPSGNVVTYGRDPQGRIANVTLSGNGNNMTLVSSVDYRPFGPIASIQFGNGQILTKEWDQDYWPDAVTSPALNYDFTTSDVGNITQVLSNIEGNQTLEYDNLQRLKRLLDGLAPVETLTYDKVGNRESLQYGNNSPIDFDYGDATSHRLTSVNGRARSYDENGNTIGGHLSSGWAGTDFQAQYNAANRFSAIVSVSAAKAAPSPKYWSWVYNARGERVLGGQNNGPLAMAPWKFVMFDESGHFLSEFQDISQSSLPRHEDIVWIGDMPVAQIETTEESSGPVVRYVRYIHSDHLNTPRALVNAQAQDAQPMGTVVWRWKLNQAAANGSNAFGTQPPDEDPDGNALPVVFDMRFPGQLYDSSTGLHYNYFRDYEPETGRYVESDPIGLKGGVSTYGYVSQKPLTAADPRGLLGMGDHPCFGMSGAQCDLIRNPPKPTSYDMECTCSLIYTTLWGPNSQAPSPSFSYSYQMNSDGSHSVSENVLPEISASVQCCCKKPKGCNSNNSSDSYGWDSRSFSIFKAIGGSVGNGEVCLIGGTPGWPLNASDEMPR